jgi:hypothetical protein
MKMNTYAGLDVRTGNANGAVPATRLSVRDSGISVNGNISSTGALSAGSIQIGSWKISESSEGHLVFSRSGAGWDTSRGTNEGHIRMTQDGNLWLSRSTGWGWTADKLGAIEKDYIKEGQNVSVQGRAGVLDNYGGRRGSGDGDRDIGVAWGIGGHGGDYLTWRLVKQ